LERDHGQLSDKSAEIFCSFIFEESSSASEGIGMHAEFNSGDGDAVVAALANTLSVLFSLNI
jgi:hypothetical protein